MVELRPVRAWHPNTTGHDVNQLICPVYDTLSDAELRRYAAHPHNAAQFVPRPREMSAPQFVVTAVGRLGQALTAGAFIQDDRPAYYVYGISYVPPADILETIEPAHRGTGTCCWDSWARSRSIPLTLGRWRCTSGRSPTG